jgi:hypothetical protein
MRMHQANRMQNAAFILLQHTFRLNLKIYSGPSWWTSDAYLGLVHRIIEAVEYHLTRINSPSRSWRLSTAIMRRACQPGGTPGLD